MDNYFAMNIKNQIPTSVLQSGRLSLLNWLNGFENNNVIEFDAITNLASDICKTPIALIGLIEGNSFNFKSAFTTAAGELQRAERICQQVVQDKELVEFIEPDGLTGDPAFCAGIPLNTSEGNLIGVLCIISYNLQALTDAEKTALENLANLATSLFEQRWLALMEEKQFKFLEENSLVEMYLINPENLKVLYANHNALRSLVYPSESFLSKDITEILVARNPQYFQQQLFDLSVNDKKSFSILVEQNNYDGSKTMVNLFVSFVREGFDSSILIISRNLSNYSSTSELENLRFFEPVISESVQTTK